MITKTDSRGVQNGKELVRLAFKSTDNKPTTGIMNGSTGIEVNTGKKYVFDEESGEWTEIASSGGGGGGGGSWQTVFEGSVTTVEEDGNVSGDIRGLSSLSGNSIKATFNGTEYELPRNQYGYGAIGEQGPDFSEYPLFIFTGSDPCMLYTETAGTYTLKIEEQHGGGGGEFPVAILVDTVEVSEGNETGYLSSATVGEIKNALTNNKTVFVNIGESIRVVASVTINNVGLKNVSITTNINVMEWKVSSGNTYLARYTSDSDYPIFVRSIT